MKINLTAGDEVEYGDEAQPEDNIKWVRPDFRIKDTNVLIEYWGMKFGNSENPEYDEKAEKKIELYEEEGYQLIEIFHDHLGVLDHVLKSEVSKKIEIDKQKKSYLGDYKLNKNIITEESFETKNFVEEVSNQEIPNRVYSDEPFECSLTIEGLPDEELRKDFDFVSNKFKFSSGYDSSNNFSPLDKGKIKGRGIGHDGRCGFCEYFRKLTRGKIHENKIKGSFTFQGCPFNSDQDFDYTEDTEKRRRELLNLLSKQKSPK